MEALKTMRFSDMKLGEGTIIFEKQQFGLYDDLVKRHPENETYKKALSRLAEMIEDHEKQLKAESGAGPQE